MSFATIRCSLFAIHCFAAAAAVLVTPVRAEVSVPTTEGFFLSAKPVWPKGEEQTLNGFFRFRTSFAAESNALVTVRVTSGWPYRAKLNGKFAGYGPARCAGDVYRVDEWRLPARAGENVLEIEASGSNCSCFYQAPATPFLQAEVVRGGEVLAATSANGDFKAYETGRLRKVPRFSFQRTFSEVWRLPEREKGPLALAEQGKKRLLPREWDEPDFSIADAFRPLYREKTRQDSGLAIEYPRYFTADKKAFGRYDIEAFEANPYEKLRRTVTVSRTPAEGEPGVSVPIADGEAVVFSAPRIEAGFPSMRVKCLKPGTLQLQFDEIIQKDGSFKDERTESVGAVTWMFDEPGEYAVESFEPMGFKYARLIATDGGSFEAVPYVRSFVSPSTRQAAFSASDPALAKIFEAARRSYVANAVDCLTDCPTRERAGWLGDSFFTGRASQWLTGSGRNERLFLDNFRLPWKFDAPKLFDGLVPAVYPADLKNTPDAFIPTYAMWLVMELEDYVKRTGDRELAKAFGARIVILLRYLDKYCNADGLLEKLPGWVFVEWSKANDLVQDVNYPVNMMFARALESAGRLYGRKDWYERANRIRETIRRQSWTGEWFCDNAVRGADGKLKLSGECTEVCQYYAFFTGLATKDTHGQLWTRLMDEFGPNRVQEGKYPKIHPANFIFGTCLRMELLSQAGRSAQILREIRDYFLFMADRTGTLWEHNRPSASCCHGFASIAAEYLYRDVLGVRAIDRVNRTIVVEPDETLPLDKCETTLPLSETESARICWYRVNGQLKTYVNLPHGWRRLSRSSAPSGNLLGNAGFELGAAGWNVRTRVPQAAADWRGVEAEETEDAHSGRRALQIANPNGYSLMFVGRPVPLRPGTNYVFSAWAKASAPCEVTLGHLGPAKLGWYSGGTRHKIGTSWQRIVCKLRAQEPWTQTEPTLSFDAPVTLTLDDLQFEAGTEATHFAPRAAVETAFAETRTWTTPGSFETELRAVRYAGAEGDAVLNLCATNALTDWKWSEKRTLNLKPGEAVCVPVSVPLESRGVVTLATQGAEASSVPWMLAVLEPQTRGKADLSKGFTVGVNQLPSIPTYEYPKNRIVYSCGGTYAETLAMLRACGSQTVRLFATIWLGGKVPEAHPERGPWDFSPVERLSQLVKESELEPFLELEPETFSYRPWMTNGFNAVRNAHYMVRDAEKTHVTNACGSVACHPKMADWTDFVRAAATHCFGGARWVEICNEPNLTMKEGAAYLPYLKAAYETVKKADPALGVVGFSATEDYGCNGREFFEDCCRLGATAYCDAMSFHPYSTQVDNSVEPTQKTTDWLKQLAKTEETGKPLWNTECFYLHSRKDFHYCKFVTKDPDWLPSRNLMRRLVIDAGEGVRVSTPLRVDQLFVDPYGRAGVEVDYLGQRPVPGEPAVVQAFAARLLSDAKTLGKIDARLPEGVRGYAFADGKGAAFAVIWSFEDPKRFRFAYAGEVRDMYGNRLAARRDYLMDERPLVLSGASQDDILGKLRFVPEKREKVLVDTDIGGDVDDALALAYFLKEPRCDLMGVTTVSRNTAGKAEIVSAICRNYGRPDVTIVPGAALPMATGHRLSAHEDGRYHPVVKGRPHDVFQASADAVGFLRRTIRENPGEVTLVALGPLTNVGMLFASDPEVAGLLKRLVIIGGEMTGVCEWNALCDPVAMAVAFGAGHGSRPPETLLFGAEVTTPFNVSPDEGRAFMKDIPSFDIVREAAEYWYRDGFNLFFHDPIVAVAVFHPEIATYRPATVSVDLAHEGRTTVDASLETYARSPLRLAQKLDFGLFKKIFSSTLMRKEN